jgi:hypothetical protein
MKVRATGFTLPAYIQNPEVDIRGLCMVFDVIQSIFCVFSLPGASEMSVAK